MLTRSRWLNFDKTTSGLSIAALKPAPFKLSSQAHKPSLKMLTLVMVAMLLVAGFGVKMAYGAVTTTTMLPSTDITAQWPGRGGTSDSSCAGGTACDYVDDGTTDDTSDYISTNGSTAGGEVVEFGLNDVASVQSATQLEVRVYAMSATNANGDTLDDISINLRINGTLQIASTCTPSYNSWGECIATFSGSWTQSDVNSMRVYINRVVQGSGNPSARADNVQVANIYGTLTYTPNLTAEQSAYRWFNNQDISADTTFIKTYGGSYADYAEDVTQTSDGGYVVTGATGSFGAGGDDMFLAKFDSLGNLSWDITWGGSGSDVGNSIIQTSDNGYAVTGETGSFGAGGFDMFLAKFDSSGNLSWDTTWGGSGSDLGNSLVQASDDSYIITGRTNSFSASYDTFLAKFDSSGNLSWDTTWGGSSSDFGNSLVQASDDGYVVTGSTASFGAGNTDTFLAKFDSSGNFVWDTIWGGTGYDPANSLVQTSDDGYAVTGSTSSFGAGNTDTFLAKFDSSGNLSWDTAWGGSGSDYGEALVQASDDSYIITGRTTSFSASYDTFLVKLDSSGNLVWDTTWNGGDNDTAVSLVQTSDDGYAIVGSTNSGDILFAKFDSSGDIANCSGLDCQDPAPSISDPAPSISDPAAGISDPAASISDPAATVAGNVGYSTTSAVELNPSTIGVGSALAAQDTAATAPNEGTIFRLRLDLHFDGAAVGADSLDYKLQYADKGAAASCSAVSTDDYNDVSDTTVIRYADNVKAASGLTPDSDPNNPVHNPGTAHTNVEQAYLEQGTTSFSNPNSMAAGEDGMWGFALVAHHSIENTTYCFRVVTDSGSQLDSYSVYPEITTPPASFSMSDYRWYNPEPSGSAQTFIKAYGSSDDDFGNSLVRTSDDGYAVVGSTYSYGTGLSDMLLTKYDSAGNLSWSKTWGGSDVDIGESLVQTSDGGYAVTGETASYGAGSRDMFLVKYDSSGNLSWSKTWGGTDYDKGYSLVQTSDGGYAITGDTVSYGAGSSDIFLAKYDSSGNLSWSKTWGNSADEVGYSLVQTSDGGYTITGGGSLSTMLLVKFDASGNLVWGKYWSDVTSHGRSIVQTSDGGYAVTGFVATAGWGESDIVLVKFNSLGELSWDTSLNLGDLDYGFSVIQTSDGGYAITGAVKDLLAHVIIAKFDSSGNLSWQDTFVNDSGVVTTATLVQASDGGYTVAGSGSTYGAGSSDLFLAKYDSSGNMYNCPISVCSDILITTAPLSYTADNYSATTSSPSATTSSPSNATTSPGLTTTTVVASPVSIGNPLAEPNTPLDLPELTPVNLRINVRVDDSGISKNSQSFKLVYAVKSGDYTCQTMPLISFADVTDTSPIAFYDDSQYTSGQLITENPNDPGDGSRTIVPQSYQESNPFTNLTAPVYAGQDGMWQFTLAIDNTTLKGRDFCLRVAEADGTTVSAINVAEVAYSAQMIQLMGGGNWWNRSGERQNLIL